MQCMSTLSTTSGQAAPSRAHLTRRPGNKPGEVPTAVRDHNDAVAETRDADLPPLEAAVDPAICWDCGADSTDGTDGLCRPCAEIDDSPAVSAARTLSPDALVEAAANAVGLGDDDDFDDYVFEGDDASVLDSLLAESLAVAATVDLAADTLSQLHIDAADVASIDHGSDWAKIQLKAPHPTGGYTKIMALKSGLVTGFFTDFDEEPHESLPYGPETKTRLHREDGPAMIDVTTGERIPVLRGVVQTAPDDTGLFFTSYARAEDGTLDQTWMSGGGNRVAVRKANGDITFTTDGDVDRAGAPAKTVNGVDEWWRHDKQIPDPRPAPVNVAPLHGTSMKTTQHVGARYAAEDTKTVAKKLREDIKAAQYAGIIPDTADIRVTSTKDKTISISVTGITDRAQNPDRLGDGSEPWFSDEGREWNDTLQGLADQYNYWEAGVSASSARQSFYATVGFTEKSR